MFIQVLQGRAVNRAGLEQEMDRWLTEVQPGAEGWLGSTSGVTGDGEFIAIVRFDSLEAAQRNSQRPEQDAWWQRASQHLADITFHNSSRVHTYKQGGSDDAGFVQVVQGHASDMDRLAELGRSGEEEMQARAPHILGMTVAEHADRPGDFTQTVYFSSEDEARRYERDNPPQSNPTMVEAIKLMSDLRYFDLREPRLVSAK